jgi:hypothetical protein
MVSEDLRYTFYALRRGQFMSEASNTALDWLKESLSEMWEKEIWPPSSPGCNGVLRQGHHGEGLQEF